MTHKKNIYLIITNLVLLFAITNIIIIIYQPASSQEIGLNNITQTVDEIKFDEPIYKSTSGQLTSIRLLEIEPNTVIEESLAENGFMPGIGNISNFGTYTDTFTSERSVHGKGMGILMSEDGQDLVKWTAVDKGIRNGTELTYHGIIFFGKSSGEKFDFLENTTGIYVGKVSNSESSRTIWEWK